MVRTSITQTENGLYKYEVRSWSGRKVLFSRTAATEEKAREMALHYLYSRATVRRPDTENYYEHTQHGEVLTNEFSSEEYSERFEGSSEQRELAGDGDYFQYDDDFGTDD